MFRDGDVVKTKFIIAGYKVPVTIHCRQERLWFEFAFNRNLQAEIKMMEGSKWHGYEDPPIKKWSVANSSRNFFQIQYLEGKNPYAPYDKELLEINPRRSLYSHQVMMFRHMITRQYALVSAEMGTGKTLSAIESMEWLAANRGTSTWFYLAPKATLEAIKLELEKWKSVIIPQLFTYDGIKSILHNWPIGTPPPTGLIVDESSRVKTPTSQRSEAVKYLADQIRHHWGERGSVILMSGTPAPRSPLDWWYQCEIACPGFLREGTYSKFKQSLAILSEGQSSSGQAFQKLVSWKDDVNKCAKCGKPSSDETHSDMDDIDYHAFIPSVNEIERLYKRMKGLTIVFFKKDCTDLPDKRYRVIRCKPSQSTLNAAKIITAHSGRAIRALTLLRELSDGFQYEQVENGTETCPGCNGSKTQKDWTYGGPDEDYDKYNELALQGQFDKIPIGYFVEADIACSYCDGLGEVIKKVRESKFVPTPKDDALMDLIEEHNDIGRLVTYAGFTASIDRVCDIYKKKGWSVIRVDRGHWESDLPGKPIDLLKIFQSPTEEHPRVAFVAHPGSAGMGLTLTASPTIVYYSNDFSGEARMQSEDRIHRLGMDVNRGATIVDLIHLPSDQLILDNLKLKKKLQDLSMGDFRAAMEGDYADR